tara:strand:- start:484 stop:849 length:366 start_codon:yes stop_codon:yes gene_type:complete
MSDTKIKVESKGSTVSVSVELKVKPPVWSKKYVKFLPNEEYQRFHWVDAYKHLVKEGYNVESKPRSGPVKVNNSSEDVNAGQWVFNLVDVPKAKTETSKASKPKTPTKKTIKKSTVKPKEV